MKEQMTTVSNILQGNFFQGLEVGLVFNDF